MLFGHRARCSRAFLRGALAAVAASLAAASANAQDASDFRGAWRIDPPDSGEKIVIVKKRGEASYFWAANSDRTVYEGAWEPVGEGIAITWHDGAELRLERAASGYRATRTPSGGGETAYETAAEQMASDVLGAWARPPEGQREDASEDQGPEGYFGVWEVARGKDHVFIERDRSAASTWDGAPAAERGLRGTWEKQGGEMHIAWETGHYTVLRPAGNGHEHLRHAPGADLQNNEPETRDARRVQEKRVDDAWLAAYRKERQSGASAGGLSFEGRGETLRFYRGAWIVRQGGEQFEHIEIKRFGGLAGSDKQETKGDWRLRGQELVLHWDRGRREVLAPVGRGFVLFEYRPGRPIDGVPNRIAPAAPADAAKLEQYRAGRAAIGRRILELAKASGMDPERLKTTWGETVKDWVWPFGDERDTPSANASKDPGDDDDSPWWWPLWSDSNPPENEDRDGPTHPRRIDYAPPASGEGDDGSEGDATQDPGADDASPKKDETDAKTPSERDEATLSPSADQANGGETGGDARRGGDSSEAERGDSSDWYWPF